MREWDKSVPYGISVYDGWTLMHCERLMATELSRCFAATNSSWRWLKTGQDAFLRSSDCLLGLQVVWHAQYTVFHGLCFGP